MLMFTQSQTVQLLYFRYVRLMSKVDEINTDYYAASCYYSLSTFECDFKIESKCV